MGYVSGGGGNDSIVTGSGDDTVLGNGGDDSIRLGDGNDEAGGGDGRDTIDGQGGNDNLWGGAGNDLIYGGSGADTLSGGADNDTLYAGTGDDQMGGGSGNDLIYAGDGNDTFGGDSGNDTIWAGEGNDQGGGGTGDDVIYGEGGDDSLGGEAGNDTLWGGDGNDGLGGGDGHDELHGGAGNDGMGGNAGNDTLYGDAGHDNMGGQDGDDRLYGGAGNDTIGGDEGNDVVEGGDGDDLMWGQAGQDTMRGDAGDDRIFGGGENDVLDGGAGADRLEGEGGDDTMAGGDDPDVFIIRDGNGHDVITDFAVAQDMLAFDMAEITRFRDAAARMSQDGADTVFTFDNGDTVRLLNVSKDDLTPSNVQSVDGPICLCAGTQVATPRGPVPVESLRPGDLVLTLDGPPMPVRLVLQEVHRFRSREDRARPVLIGAGALGAGLPRQPLRLSPQHRVLMRDPLDGSEALVPAVKLADRPGIRRMRGVAQAEYVNILLDRHAVLGVAGLGVETLLVTARTLPRLPLDLRAAWAARPPMAPARPIRRNARGLFGAAFDVEAARLQPRSRAGDSEAATRSATRVVRFPHKSATRSASAGAVCTP